MNKYGCNNSERKDGYYAPQRYFTKGLIPSFTVGVVYIEDTSSKECRYDRRADDKKCEGCLK